MAMTRVKSSSNMSETDFERLLQSAKKLASGDTTGCRSSTFEGNVLVRIKEGRKTVWTLQDAAAELREILEASNFDSVSEVVVLARKVLRQSQEGFAEMLGISTATLRGWEQGRRVPHGPAQRLLWVAMKHPRAVLDTVMDDAYAV